MQANLKDEGNYLLLFGYNSTDNPFKSIPTISFNITFKPPPLQVKKVCEPKLERAFSGQKFISEYTHLALLNPAGHMYGCIDKMSLN